MTEDVLSSLLGIGGLVCVGVATSGGESLGLLEISKLERRASRRLITLELALSSGSSFVGRRKLDSWVIVSLRCRAGLPFLLLGRTLVLVISVSDLSSASATQNSAKLRHMLSALRCNCLSIPFVAPTTDA